MINLFHSTPVVLWTPRKFTAANETALASAGLELIPAPYETPDLDVPPGKIAHEHYKELMRGIWRGMVERAGVTCPDVLVWISRQPIYRPMVDVVVEETGNYTIIVTPAGRLGFIRTAKSGGRMVYSRWEPSAEAVLNRRAAMERRTQWDFSP